MPDLWKQKNLVLAGFLFLRSNYLSQRLSISHLDIFKHQLHVVLASLCIPFIYI